MKKLGPRSEGSEGKQGGRNDATKPATSLIARTTRGPRSVRAAKARSAAFRQGRTKADKVCLFCGSMNMTERAAKYCSTERDKQREPEAIQQESSYLRTRESARTLVSARVLSGDSLMCVILIGSRGSDSARVQKSVGG